MIYFRYNLCRVAGGRIGRILVRIRKEVIRPGTYFVRDKNGVDQLFTATPRHIQYWNETGNAMRAAGLPIPAPLEHDPSAHPLTPADRLLNNAGEVHNYEIGEVQENGPDGKPVTVKNVLFSNVDIKDPRALEGIRHGTIRWTSPAFDNFTDGSGKKWEGVITHLALTSRPVIHQQQPFQANFSLTPSELPLTSASGFSLSRAALVTKLQGGVFKPVYPIAFSLWTGAKFALEDMEKEKKPEKKAEGKEGKEGGKESKDGEKAQKEEGFPEEAEGAEEAPKHKFDPLTGEPVKEPLVDADGDISVWAILGDLAAMALGVDCPEEITAENGAECLLEMFRMAVQEKLAGADMSKETPGMPEEPESDNPIIQERQPMYMSLEQAKAIPDPTMRNIALSLVKTQEENKSLKQKAFNDAANIRQKRINALVKATPSLKDDLEKMAAGAQFSLESSGVINDPMGSFLTALEKQHQEYQKLVPSLLKSPAAEFSIERPPEETVGTVSTEQLKKVRESLMAAGGLK